MEGPLAATGKTIMKGKKKAAQGRRKQSIDLQRRTRNLIRVGKKERRKGAALQKCHENRGGLDLSIGETEKNPWRICGV